MQTVTIGTLAKQAGVGTGTLRYYESLGLLAPTDRSGSGYRLYHAQEIDRLRFIRRSQELGFTLAEIAVLLRLNHRTDMQAVDVKRLTEEKIADIDARIKDLALMRQGLHALVHRCDGSGSAAECPILAALNGAEE